MRIDRNNYEEFFLDYHEGTLADSLKNELFLFLEHNPDLKAEFERFDLITVPTPGKTFFEKDLLKRKLITLHNYQSYFIAYVENDIGSAEKNELELFIQQNPSLNSEFEVFKQTKIFPNHSIIFENKKQLKHRGKIIAFHSPLYRIAIAASIVLFIITYFLFQNKKEPITAHREIPKMELEKNPPSQSENNPDVILKNKIENKKEFVQKNKSEKLILHGKQSRPALMKQEIPTVVNKSGDPLVAIKNQKQNSIPENELFPDVKNVPFANLIVEKNEAVQKPFKPTVAQLSTIFNDDDLKELGVAGTVTKDKKNGLWDLASRGAQEISNVTGKDISIKRQDDDMENTKSYAFAIGNFSISHTTTK